MERSNLPVFIFIMGELKAVMLPHIRERENQDKIKIGFPFLITNLKQPENIIIKHRLK